MTAVDLPEEPAGGRISERSRGVALGLAVIGGFFGLHRFYTGRAESGVWMCLTLGGLGIWYLYDVVVIAAGDFQDGSGRRVVRWEVAGEPAGTTPSERRSSTRSCRTRSPSPRARWPVPDRGCCGSAP